MVMRRLRIMGRSGAAPRSRQLPAQVVPSQSADGGLEWGPLPRQGRIPATRSRPTTGRGLRLRIGCLSPVRRVRSDGADGLHEDQGPAQVVRGVHGEFDVAHVHESGEFAVVRPRGFEGSTYQVTKDASGIFARSSLI
jgi:hypothetical protein